MHYYLIGIIIIGIVIWQFLSFFSTLKKQSLFRNIFPVNQNAYQFIQGEIIITALSSDNQYKSHVTQDDIPKIELGKKPKHKNSILSVIINSLNKYLINNKSAVSDFHLMKDIVDRNCDAKEEEIHTQIPVPLYLGLVGTMLGILIGVGFLAFGGGLNDLLNSGNGSGAQGIETLLGGVALAMISSIIGIMLTTFGSHIAKNAKAEVESNKNTFLSWIQAELLPNISNNTSSALVGMTKNLSNFNKTFSKNTQNLGITFSKVNDSYQKQAELMQAIDKLKIDDIATANIQVYDKLKNSTNEIGVFARYLQKTNEYLTAIQALNQKLDDYEGRTQVIENAGKFFAKNEKWLAENFDIANLEVKSALDRFKNGSTESLTQLQESLNEQILNIDIVMLRQQEKLQEALKVTTRIVIESFTKTQQTFEKAISEQQLAMQSKLQETSLIVDELKNLTHIKEGIKDFKEATKKQSGKIEELTKEIRALAKVKTDGGTIKQEISFPRWFKALTIAGSSLFAVTCLFYLVPLFIEWISNLANWIF